jgi:ATP-binding cassette subfamily C (CFTR/MRP) protein 1
MFTILFDITQTRTLWLSSTDTSEITFSRLFTAGVAVKALFIILESRHKSKWIQWNVEKHSPEETIGFFGISAYTWLNNTFYGGYTKILSIKDLSPLDQRMNTEGLQFKLMHHLSTSKSKHQSFRLVKALTKTLATSLLLPIPARLALTGFKFCQPFLINTLLDYLPQPANTTTKNIGYGLIGAAILIYAGLAVSTAIYWYFHERTLCMSRSALAGAVYRKTTEVKLSAAGDAAALTLMSTDVERIRLGFLNLHEFWANTLEVGLASWLLQRQVGNAFVAPLLVVLVCITCAAFVNRFTGRRQKAWMDKIQRRVGLTANVISSMKHLKISGLAAPVEQLIQNMRVDELETASKFRTVYIIVITFGYAPLALCPVITFAVTARTLDVSTIFTSLSFLLLLADPLTYLFQNTPNLLAAFACLDRIQDFLTSDSRSDYRLPSAESTSMLSGREGSTHSDATETLNSLIKIINGTFGWEAGKATLKNLNLDIPKSQLTILVGPVASGKSTLCKVLLGEVPVSHGEIILSSGNVQKIGYCDQTPYLSNTSIKENIVGFSTFNKSRYEEVVEATMLLQDLAVLPEGERTKVGSSGINLSGGQKQRVSLARALYLDTDFFVFDDILSGLDADTEDQVFSRVFGPSGLLRQRNATVVLSTHSIQHLPSADHIIALGEDGSIVEQGSFQDLIANEKYVHSLDIKEGSVASFESHLPAKTQDLSTTDEAAVAELVPPTYLDERDRMMGDSTVYRYYLTSLGKTSITAFITFGLGWGFFYNFGTVWLRFWSDDVSSPHPSRSNSFYIGLYGLFQLSYLLCMFFSFLICFRTMIEVSGSKLHKAALGTVIAAPLKFFTTTDTGLVTNFFSQDMTLIDNELPIAITNLACDVANALGMAAVIASSSPYLAISYPFIFVLLYVIQKFYLRTSRQLRLLDLEAKSPL